MTKDDNQDGGNAEIKREGCNLGPHGKHLLGYGPEFWDRVEELANDPNLPPAQRDEGPDPFGLNWAWITWGGWSLGPITWRLLRFGPEFWDEVEKLSKDPDSRRQLGEEVKVAIETWPGWREFAQIQARNEESKSSPGDS